MIIVEIKGEGASVCVHEATGLCHCCHCQTPRHRETLARDKALHDHRPPAIRRLSPVHARCQGDADALGGPKLCMFPLGGDPLQGAQRTRNEQEH